MSVQVDLVTSYWTAAEARDWDAFRALVAEDVVYEAPQSRERVRGRSVIPAIAFTWLTQPHARFMCPASPGPRPRSRHSPAG